MSEELVTHYQYSPTFGGVVTEAPTGSPFYRLVGQRASLALFLTNDGFVIRANVGEVEEIVGHGYQFLSSISVETGLILRISDGTEVRFSSTFAHWKAAEIWVNLANIILSFWGDTQDVLRRDYCLSLLTSIDSSTIEVPEGFDFYRKKDQYHPLVDQMCLVVTGGSPRLLAKWNVSRSPLSLLQEIEVKQSNSVPAPDSGMIDVVRMPRLRSGMQSGYLIGWVKIEGDIFDKGDHLFSVGYGGELIKVFADRKGSIIEIFHRSDSQQAVGEILASVEYVNAASSSPKANSSSLSIVGKESPVVTLSRITTSEAMQSRVSVTGAGRMPSFLASPAVVPEGFVGTGSDESDLAFAIGNPRIGFQSFFNDLDVVVDSGLNDDVINLPCFDEDLYSRLTREMHRYTLAEVGDQKDSLAKQNARLGTFVGALFGVLTSNPFAPFLGRNLGRSETDRGKRISEFLPDPHLLFYQDEHSFLSWSRAQVLAPRIRRVIFSKMQKDDGRVYFRLLPALVTADSVLPIQVFKLDKSSYFYRPFAAGIDRRQQHYDAVKIQRRYMHVHAQGVVSKSELRMTVSGSDIEDCQTSLYRFSGQSLEYFYADFKILPGYVF